jgi:hypothetical protein
MIRKSGRSTFLVTNRYVLIKLLYSDCCFYGFFCPIMVTVIHLFMQFVGLYWCCHELPLWAVHFRCRLWSEPQVARTLWCCNNRKVCVCFLIFFYSGVGIYLMRVSTSSAKMVISEFSVQSQVSSTMIIVLGSLKLSLILRNFWMLIFRQVNCSTLNNLYISLVFFYFLISMILREDWKSKI